MRTGVRVSNWLRMAVRGSTSLRFFMVGVTGPTGGVRLPALTQTTVASTAVMSTDLAMGINGWCMDQFLSSGCDRASIAG